MKVFLNGQGYDTDSVVITAEKGLTVSMEDAGGVFYGGKLDRTTTITAQETLTTGWGALPNAKATQTDKQETLFPKGIEVIPETPRQS